LVKALSAFDDDPIARQLIDLIVNFYGSGDALLCAQFVAMLSDRYMSPSWPPSLCFFFSSSSSSFFFFFK
jgi:protein involved in sex pheromone biosynthesis